MDFCNPDGMRDLYETIYSDYNAEYLVENRKMARDPEGRKSGYSKQPDPSKPGFTGIGNMSIDQIRKMSARIEKKQKTTEEVDLYDQMLEFLCVEGYADTLEEAEWIMANCLVGEDIEAILEGKKEPNFVKMKRQSYKHRQQSITQRGGGRGDAKNRSFKMDGIIDALERGEDPRRDTRGGKRSEPEDHRARFTTKQKPRPAKKPGV